jgi:hypothetical protein
MSEERASNGRFGPGNRGNPNGRPPNSRSLVDQVTRELQAKVTITENGRRKRVSKLAANAKQIANQGASGDIKAAKLTVDYAMKAEKEREPAPAEPALTENDRAIAMRFIARLQATQFNKDDDHDHA